MGITRRDFLKYCGISAAALGLSSLDLLRLKEVLASSPPPVLWLQGAACTGCSVSLLNRISGSAPTDIADLLVNTINLTYHPNLMSLAGDSAAAQAVGAQAAPYFLAVEGGVPQAFGGRTCWAWNQNGADKTFLEVVTSLAQDANCQGVLSIGTCAAFGGIPQAGPNPAGVASVQDATGVATINIAGCPPHPDWIVGTIAQVLLGTLSLDKLGRPLPLYASTVHDQCPRLHNPRAITFGADNDCLIYLGCQGPVTRGACPATLWNNRVNWCVDANARCLRCTEPSFPGSQLFLYVGTGNEEHSAAFIQSNKYNCTQCHHGTTVGGGDD